ncbi:hypothetical protein GQ457_08G027660 [Hibiscus cannabinus]
MPSCYASYHHRSTSHWLVSHPTKPRSISRLTQHSTKVEATTHSGSPRSSYDSLSGMLSIISHPFTITFITMNHLHAFMSIQNIHCNEK